MQLTLNKTELAGALAALGKLVSRTSLVKVYQAVQIEGKANTLCFRTHNDAEEIEFRMTAELEKDFPAVLIEFEQLRLAVRNTKNKTLSLEVENGELIIEGVKLASVDGRFPEKEEVPDQDVNITELPADTLSAMEKLAPIANKGQDIRKVLGGINLSRDGFTATNGKELSNIPAALDMGSVTIPFPLALLATKAFGQSGRLSTWQKDDDTHFELVLGSWTWRAKAYRENYPNWKRILPERKATTHYVSFQQDRAERLQRHLRGVPDDQRMPTTIKLSRLAEVPDNLHLESSNGMLFNVLAEFDDAWGDLSFTVRKDIFAHLLNAGHTRIELNDAYGPFIGTGGMGQFVAMPVRIKPAKVASEQKQKETAPESTDQITSTNTTTNPNQEKSTMIDTNTIIHTVSAPEQTLTPNNKTENKLNPLDELTVSIEAFKAKIKDVLEDATILSRRSREVSIAQKQKEREYAQTKKTIEKIRVASGF